MAHPLVWMRKSYFFPTGDWPSVCLTQELCPEEDAEILLLGCGDPRSILFTVYHDLAPDYRRMDVTCCDWEPAVIARNIIILTMIADGTSTETIWSIFFHLFLDPTAYDQLIAHCRTLIQCSSDLEAWKASKYGSYIRFCTERSFSDVRSYWIKYSEVDVLPEQEKGVVRKSFMAEMESCRKRCQSGNILNSLRSSGPICPFVDQHEASTSYPRYWTTGTTNESSIIPPHWNPTFYYASFGGGFSVFYGIEPLPAFNLSPGLIPVKGVHSSPKQKLRDVVNSVKDQFRLWCSAFKTRIATGRAPNLVLRFHVGEAMTFCRALLVCQRTKSAHSGAYAMQWGGAQIVLDDDDYAGNRSSAPLAFHVIDTSNFANHLGMLNVLTATVPLLQQKPWATLRTDILVSLDLSNGLPTSTLADHVGDIPSISLAFGVAPSSSLSHFTTYSNKHELIAGALSVCTQTRDRVVWRAPSHIVSGFVGNDLAADLQRPVIQKWPAKDLGRYLFAIYLKMFDDESLASLRTFTPAAFKKISLSQYTREGLVAFMALVKERVKSDWIDAMEAFDDLQAADQTLLLGNTHYQDFICQLYLYDVYVMESMKSAFLESLRGRNNLFRGWKDIPPVVCAILKVPRNRMKVLEEMSRDSVGSPILQCEMRSTQFHNVYSSIRPIFGKIITSSVGGEVSVSIDEDLREWDGDSDLIVTFYLPSWTLLQVPPEAVEISLIFKSTPYAVSALASTLGRRLCIYSTKLSDSENVLLVRHRPNNPEEIHIFRVHNSSASSARAGQTASISVDVSIPKVASVTVRHNITDPIARANLLSGVAVEKEAITDTALRVYIDEYEQTFVYPFPIRTDLLKVRIARKSSYVEIEAPVRSDFKNTRNPSINLFPIAREHNIINLLNMHYVNLDTLPALQIPSPQHRPDAWLIPHLGMTMTQREREEGKSQEQAQLGMIWNLKESITNLFHKHMISQEHPRVFALANPQNGTGVYAYIFINEIRLDLSAQTIVADACVVPFSLGMMKDIIGALKNVTPIQFSTLTDEAALWKKVFPAFAERCRTWKHTESCEYLRKGIPALTEFEMYANSPLCSCGHGKNLGSFEKVKSWAPFAPYATRIAIALLFTFSNGELLKSFRRSGHGGPPSPPSPPSNSTNCTYCGKPEASQMCSKCKTARYCSSTCQKNDWKIHKMRCSSAQK